ncbi:MAG: hypothetical protein AAGA96_12705 [Verrucomicrobiota bacterium]
MAKAKNLRELLQIREKERDYINSVTGNLGSAIGLKNGDGDPCVVIFVSQKIDAKWLKGSGQLIKKTLRGPNGLTCPTDVVQGRKYESIYDVHLVDVTLGNRFSYAPVVSRKDFLGPPPLQSPGQIDLLERARGWTPTIAPGSQLYHSQGWFGTLGCFVRKSSGTKGILTNEHVAGPVGSKLFFPNENGIHLATVKETFEVINDEVRFPGIIDEPSSEYRVDCAFAELSSAVDLDDLEAKIPTLDSEDTAVFRELGDPLELDLDTLGPLGMSVAGVGRTRSFQRGTIAGFAYSFNVFPLSYSPPIKNYTDFLIVGEDNDQFSAPGDSGKLIVTDEKVPRPVALLWGGWEERLRQSRMQEDWTYAIDINKVLDLLKVSVAKRI